LYSLLKAGIPLTRALAGLQESAEPAMAAVIQGTRESLESGHELGTSLARQGGVFSNFYIAMVRVGELTGRLDEVFIRLFHHLSFEKLMREQVRSALRYPSFVVIVMLVAIAVVNVFVIPAFQKVFDGFGTQLPLMTRILVGFSKFTVTMWPYLVVAGVLARPRWRVLRAALRWR
jgi:MSHA biogenesis protein MshG